MDINHGDRRMRSLLRRTCGCLLLVILWQFNGAWGEAAGLSSLAYISMVNIPKYITIYNNIEYQNSCIGGENLVYCVADILLGAPGSFLSRPYRPYPWRIRSKRAFGDDNVNGVTQSSQSSTHSKYIPARTCAPRRGRPVILKSVAEQGVKLDFAASGSGRLALQRCMGELEAVKYGADIGAELPVSGVCGNGYLTISSIYGPESLNSGIHSCPEEEGSKYRIKNSGFSSATSPFQALPVVLLALCLGGFVCAFKGIDSEGDLLMFGGTAISAISAVVLLWWLLDHLITRLGG